MNVHVVDPSAFTPPYDHALCAALARAGATRGAHHQPVCLRRRSRPPTATCGASASTATCPARAGSPVRRVAKAAVHVPRDARLPARRRRGRRRALPVARPAVARPLAAAPAGRSCSPPTTCSPASRGLARPAPSAGSMTRSTRSSCTPPTGAAQLVDGLRLAAGQSRGRPPWRLHPPHRGARFRAAAPRAARRRGSGRPVLRASAPLQGPGDAAGRVARDRARRSSGSSVGPRMPLAPLQSLAPPGVRFVPRFVARRRGGGLLSPRRCRRAALRAHRAL